MRKAALAAGLAACLLAVPAGAWAAQVRAPSTGDRVVAGMANSSAGFQMEVASLTSFVRSAGLSSAQHSEFLETLIGILNQFVTYFATSEGSSAVVAAVLSGGKRGAAADVLVGDKQTAVSYDETAVSDLRALNLRGAAASMRAAAAALDKVACALLPLGYPLDCAKLAVLPPRP